MIWENPNLTYHLVRPKRVTRTTLVKYPNSLVEGLERTELLCAAGEASMLIDYQEEAVGRLELRLYCAADAHIEVLYEETPDAAMRREEYVSSWYRQPRDVYDLKPGGHIIKSRGRRGFRYVGLFVTSADTVKLTTAVAISGNWQMEERGSFCCSDERLNRIWDISRNTARACMQDFYEDGVKRDGLLWIGDFRIAFMAGWDVFGDASLARRSLLMIRDSQYATGAIPACCADGGGHQHDHEGGISYMPGIPVNLGGWVIINYLADYLCAVDEYVLRTGDQSILPEIMESVEKTARFMLKASDLDTPGQWWIDEFETKKDADGQRYSIHHDCKNMPNMNIGSKGGVLCEMLMGMQALVRLAKRAENAGLLQWAREMTERLDQHIETHYREGLFHQYIDQVRQKAPQVSQNVTMRAILAGKEDKKGAERMTRMLLPNMSFALVWRAEALMKAGMKQEALNDIRAAWGKMLDHDSLTCWERLDVPEMNATHYYDAPGSYCHGWGAGPAFQLSEWILGIRPVKDGYEEIVIEPDLIDLQWAEGVVPAPQGEVFVRAEKTDDGVKLTVDLPEGVKKCTVRWKDGKCEELISPGMHILTPAQEKQ